MSDAQTEDDFYAAILEGADLASHDELDGARAAFARAVTLATQLDGGSGRASAEARFHLATCRAEQGAYEDALEGLDRAVGAMERLAEIDAGLLGRMKVSRAAVLAAIDRMDDAIADTRAAIALLDRGDPDHAPLVESARQMLTDIEAARAEVAPPAG